MATAITDCGCGCNPCVCVPPSQAGKGACLPTLCLPRPTFFDGQVIGSDDLNAVVSYARNQQATLARLLGGWGILGGLKLDAAPALRRNRLAAGNLLHLSNNPQAIAGTRIQVSSGVAIDAAGNQLTLCAPVELDIGAMAEQTPEARLVTGTCAELLGAECRSAATRITASELFLIAELTETPTRPVGRVGGAASCDAVIGCQASRSVEQVKFSLIADLPDTYQFTGCVGAVDFQLPAVKLGTQGDAQLCRDEVFAFIDNVQQQLANICCQRPAVVLGRVLLTRAPGNLAAGLPSVPEYLIVTDAYPCRKPTFQVGWFTKAWPNIICNQVVSSPAIAPLTVVQTAGDHVREEVTMSPATPDFVALNRQNGAVLQAQLARPRLATSSLKVTFSASFALQDAGALRFRVYVDGAPVSVNNQALLLADVDPRTSTVQISDTLPPSVLGEARAHSVMVVLSLTTAQGAQNTATISFDPTDHSGASIVIQEISG